MQEENKNTENQEQEVENISPRGNKILNGFNKNFMRNQKSQENTAKAIKKKPNLFWIIIGVVVLLVIVYALTTKKDDIQLAAQQNPASQEEIDFTQEAEIIEQAQPVTVKPKQQDKSQSIKKVQIDKSKAMLNAYELALNKKETLYILEQKLRTAQNNVDLAKENLRAESFKNITPTLYQELLEKIDAESAQKIKAYKEAIKFLKRELKIEAGNVSDQESTPREQSVAKPINKEVQATTKQYLDDEEEDEEEVDLDFMVPHENAQEDFVTEDNIFQDQESQQQVAPNSNTTKNSNAVEEDELPLPF